MSAVSTSSSSSFESLIQPLMAEQRPEYCISARPEDLFVLKEDNKSVYHLATVVVSGKDAVPISVLVLWETYNRRQGPKFDFQKVVLFKTDGSFEELDVAATGAQYVFRKK